MEIEERKRRLYLIASVIGLPSVYFVWRVYGVRDPFIRYVYPFLIAEAILWIAALLWQRVPLAWIEHFVLYSLGIFFLVKLTYYLYFVDPATAWKEIESLTGGMLIIFILAYIILSHRVALRSVLIYIALTFLVGLARTLPEPGELMTDFIRLETRLVTVAVLTYILAKVKDDLALSQKRAAYWEWQANIDHLTQLPNRRMLSALLEEYLQAKKTFAILLVDLDDFKCFNDTYGHDVGDVLLGRVAFTLKTNLRASDTAARWGGEEFLVVTETNQAQAKALAERLRLEVQKIDFDQNLISISIGGTMSIRGEDLSSLLKRADEALYCAKAAGRNCVCWA